MGGLIEIGAGSASGGGGGPATIADGADVAQGAKADSAATDSTSSWSIIALLKGLFSKLPSIGQKTMANSQPVVIASDQSAVPVQFNVSTTQTLSLSNSTQTFTTTNYSTLSLTLSANAVSVTCQASDDGTTYVPILGIPLGGGPGTSTLVGTGSWIFDVTSYNNIQFTSTSTASGKFSASGGAGSVEVVNFPYGTKTMANSLATTNNNQVLFRDDFDGSSLSGSNWSTIATGSGMSVQVYNSRLRIKAGTTANSETIIRSVNTYPLSSIFRWGLAQNVSQIDQEVVVEAIQTPPTLVSGATWTRVTNANFNYTSTIAQNTLVITSGTAVQGSFIAGTGIAANTYIEETDGTTYAILNINASASGSNTTTSHLSMTIAQTAHGLARGQWIELEFVTDATSQADAATNWGYNTATIGTQFIVTGVTDANNFLVIPNAGTFAGTSTSGTINYYPYTTNIVAFRHDGATATSGRFQTWTNGYSYTQILNALAVVTQTTGVNPGLTAQMRTNFGYAYYADTTLNSTSGANFRAVRDLRVPDPSTQVYFQIRVKNIGAPVTNQYFDFDFVTIEQPMEIPVYSTSHSVLYNGKDSTPVTITSANNASVNIAQLNAGTALTASPNGATSKSLGVLLGSALNNADQSATAFAGAGRVNGTVVADVSGDGLSCSWDINVTAITLGTATAVLFVLQESYDNGTTFNDIWVSRIFTATGHDHCPCLPIGGRRRWTAVSFGGTSTTVTVTITAMKMPGVWPVQRRLIDVGAGTNALATVIDGATTASTLALATGATVSAPINVEGCKYYTIALQVTAGTPTTPPVLTLQFSNDNSVWWSSATTVTPAAAGLVTSSLTTPMQARYARLNVTTGQSGGTPYTLTYAGITASA